MITLLKGIVVGMGGIAPGLSGSVLLVIFGLYERAINSVSTLFKSFKKNIAFLFPLLLGFGIGILLFSKVIDFFLESFEMQTRFTFLGLVLGTVPLFYKEVKKNGFSKRYYIVIGVAAALGFLLLLFSSECYGAGNGFSVFRICHLCSLSGSMPTAARMLPSSMAIQCRGA